MLTVTETTNAPSSSVFGPAQVEWRRYSRNGEDGVLASLFSLIGTTDRQYVEIGCEDGTECNTRFLRQSGWSGWMFDAEHERAEIRLCKATITRENVDAILQRHGVPTQFDLLSVDIDFNDFHVLDSILVNHRPRVVVVEYNASLGPDQDAVVPYQSSRRWDGTKWFGASMMALCRLGNAHGYVPVYCESMGVNLFMVHRDVWGSRPHPSPSLIYKPPAYGSQRKGHKDDTQARPFLSSAHYLVAGAARVFTRYGQLSYLANDEFIGGVFARGGYWEEFEVRRVGELLGNVAALAVDVGAHVGSHSVALAALCPQLSFICFEPQTVLRLLLERNIAENNLTERFVVSPKAVVHREMRVSLATSFSDGSAANQAIKYDGATIANYGGVQLGAGGETVDTVSLDSLASAPIAYIKLDVEGAERLAIAGARRVLESQRPLMLFEHRDDRQLPAEVLDRFGVSAELRAFDVRSFLLGLGYRLAPLGQDVVAVPSNASPTGFGPEEINATSTPGSSPAEESAGVPSFDPSASLPATADCTGTVPAVLFQTWKTRGNLPTEFARCRQSFLDMCKNFATPLWDDHDNRQFVKHHFDWFLPLYEAYPKEIYRADAVRYFFLYAFGGIYADLDVYCLKPLDSIIGQPALVLGRMGADPDFEHSVPNAVMASCPRHPFWLLVIAGMIEAQARNPAARPEYLTGPVVLKSALDVYACQSERAFDLIGAVARHLPGHLQPAAVDTVVALCGNDWFPFNWADPIHQLYRQALRSQSTVPHAQLCRKLFPNATLVTFWSHSWEPEPKFDIKGA